MRVANKLASAVEGARSLDRPAKAIGDLGTQLVGHGRRRDVLSGTALGHPAHPAVVMVPLGMWSAAVLRGLAGDDRSARRLTGLGLMAAVPAVATGLSDWLDTEGAEKRVGLVHLAANSTAFGLFALSWRARGRGRTARGNALALAGSALAGAGGWLGGHLAYALGVGVDTNAFEGGPTEWTPLSPSGAGSVAEGELAAGVVDRVGVVVSRCDGDLAVLANRCSHRGGPLADGEVSAGCVRCPWHGSEFELRSGAVRRGPAVVPQPAYEVRQGGDGVEARRAGETRALRLNTFHP